MQDARPPFVSFERRAVEDRAESIRQGKYMTRDVDFIVVVPHGSAGKLSIEEVYEEWLAKIRPLAGVDIRAPGAMSDTPLMAASRFPYEWLEKIERAYAAWKSGQELPIEGTPIENWPVLSPAQLVNCRSINIRTVEELAVATDDAVGRIGIGGIALRQRARDWLEALKSDAGKVSGEMEALKVENASLQQRLQELEDRLSQSLPPPKKV